MDKPVFGPAEILLPALGADLARWAVIACDQFTSQPAYWNRVEELVGDAPSALRLVLPELYLDQPGVEGRIEAIHRAMETYAKTELAAPFKGYMAVERRMQSGAVRQGLLGCVDLEAYSFGEQDAPLIRPTENTVLSRIPPRLAVRRGGMLECPHILMLIDDERRMVVEPAVTLAKRRPPAYEVELMLGGGHLAGWKVEDESEVAEIGQLFETFAAAALDQSTFGGQNTRPFLMALGDGNHSLASAKALWEQIKPTLTEELRANHPARYCLVELENIQSEAVEVEPIHRAVFGAGGNDLMEALERFAQGQGAKLEEKTGPQGFKVLFGGEQRTYAVEHSPFPLAAGFVQAFLSWAENENPALRVDYIHGQEALQELCAKGAVGFLLPPLDKGDLFRGVALGGVLPKKTFSMGHAVEKRYYLECRKIL